MIIVAIGLILGVLYLSFACAYDIVFGGEADVHAHGWDWS
jgi:hypothetical protein